MAKYKVSIEMEIDLSGNLLQDYFGQLMDYEDTFSQRAWFLLDYFAPLDYSSDHKSQLQKLGINKNARISVTELLPK